MMLKLYVIIEARAFFDILDDGESLEHSSNTIAPASKALAYASTIVPPGVISTPSSESHSSVKFPLVRPGTKLETFTIHSIISRAQQAGSIQKLMVVVPWLPHG